MNIDQYLFEIQYLAEQTDKQKYRDELKSWWPSLCNDFLAFSQMLNPSRMQNLPSEHKMIKKYIKGLDFTLGLNYSTTRNAFTCPAIGTHDQLENLQGLLGGIYYMIEGSKFVKGPGQKILRSAKNKGGIITYPSSKLHVAAFFTKGLIADLEERERVAIFLHEVGHWAHMKNPVSEALFSLLSLTIVLVPLVVISQIIAARAAETKSDLYAKKLGFGDDLSSALQNALLRPRKYAHWTTRTNDFIFRGMVHINNILDKILPIGDHPSLKKRQALLASSNEGLRLNPMLFTKKNLPVLESLALREGAVYDKFVMVAKPICLAIDKMISKNIKALLPIK